MKERIKRIFSRADDVDCAVIYNSVEPHLDMCFFHVTGLTDGLFEHGGAVIYPDGGMDLVSSMLEEPSAKKCKARLHLFKKLEEATEVFRGLLAGKKKIGINAEELTHAGFQNLTRWAPDASFVDISQAFKEARAVKDAAELECLARSCAIASEVAREIPSKVRVGRRESELASEMAYLLQKKGASKPNFTLVSFGPNSAEPHYMGGEGVLKTGQFVLLDFGCVFMRYNSDITRTFVTGRASEKQKRIHATVQEAQQAALDVIKAGADAKEVHAAAVGVIDRTEFKGRFTHSTGHSLGLSTHDGQRLFTFSFPLEENMVFTVEPGIYLPGYGGVRIEDDVVVTRGRPRLLTDAPRELLEL